MKARVVVTLKNGVLDPQGNAIEGSLDALSFQGIQSVRQGKIFDVELDTDSADEARKTLTAICEKLLANTVIEDFEINL
ncbi:phosphoribosylformylglycinamidine synthase subunit PurS [Pararhizobium sp. IMCC21322]|uniref:phosphoribosylformylglycinamidine synthase subunit PurS n=1 Tax=Pararhizobium sp. IMCC21322 TaxID=3067903 RepID=UPI0027424C0E|nr:phosphoribosylformylglycinamidine synthase subunit PurS [Pararhizobium sp. IMCC21322]